MHELDRILTSYKIAKDAQRKVVLATVVHVKGSSYRRAGARMLVDELGNMTGSISGGCLEGDALRKALYAQAQNKNKLISYDTSDEDDAIIGAQLGCNGVIQVLFEPIDFEDPSNPIEILRTVQLAKQGVVCTFFHLERQKEQVGTRCWIDENEEFFGEVDPSFKNQLTADGNEALTKKTSLFREYVKGENSQFAFLEVFKPPIKLVIVGAGNDAQIMSRMAEILGWEIVIVDGRSTHANSSRFQGSCQVIVTKPEAILEKLEINQNTAFVLMTHNYNYDLSTLRILLRKKQLKYIGILGPKIKYDRMLEDLVMDERENDNLKRVHAPVGLELGAETPAEIALSILAEIQAVMSETTASFLKEKNGPIHKERNYNFKRVEL